jgi:hypothetical protein
MEARWRAAWFPAPAGKEGVCVFGRGSSPPAGSSSAGRLFGLLTQCPPQKIGSTVAQWKRDGLITHRSLDRNQSVLNFSALSGGGGGRIGVSPWLFEARWSSGLRRHVQVVISPGGVGSNPTLVTLFPRPRLERRVFGAGPKIRRAAACFFFRFTLAVEVHGGKVEDTHGGEELKS